MNDNSRLNPDTPPPTPLEGTPSGSNLPDEGPVTGVIRRTVKPGKEEEFELWLKGVVGDALRFPGHLGANIIRPTSRSRPEYVIIFRFDTYRHLEDWETSEIRHRWVQRVQDLIIGETHIHHLSGLEYWFSVQDLPEYDAPPRIKMAIVTWLALFPVVMAVQPVFMWLLDFLPSWTRVMIIAAVMVFLMTYVVMPVMTRIFKPWLYRNPRHSWKRMELSLVSIADLLFIRTRTGFLVIIAFFFLIVLLRSRSPLLRRISAAVMWISAFTLYDVFGYDFLVMTDSTATTTLERLPELQSAYAASLSAYRILQVTFQVVLTTMVLYAAGRRAAGAAMLAWWGGACDLLYYALTMRALPESWDWMWFTPVGLFIDVLPLWLVTAQAGVLTTIAGLLLFTEAHHFQLARHFRAGVTSLLRSPKSPR